MFPQEIIDYALLKKGAYIDYPFGEYPICIKVHSKIFLQLYWNDKFKMVTLKCDPADGEMYRIMYPDMVKKGYHCPSIQAPYWITIKLNSITDEISDKLLFTMVDQAYDAVIKKLPKYIQKEIKNL